MDVLDVVPARGKDKERGSFFPTFFVQLSEREVDRLNVITAAERGLRHSHRTSL